MHEKSAKNYQLLYEVHVPGGFHNNFLVPKADSSKHFHCLNCLFKACEESNLKFLEISKQFHKSNQNVLY
jgi:hypothetical protein